MTLSYHKIESSRYTAIREKTLTRIHRTPTWQQKENMLSKLEELAINVKVHYGCARDYGLLAMVIGTARYQTDTTLVYIAPTQPPNRHASINDRSTSAQRDEYNAENNLLKRDWAVVTGFKKAVGENIRDALDSAFYEQLKAKTYAYIKLWPRDYIDHLKRKWCRLTNKIIHELQTRYRRA